MIGVVVEPLIVVWPRPGLFGYSLGVFLQALKASRGQILAAYPYLAKLRYPYYNREYSSDQTTRTFRYAIRTRVELYLPGYRLASQALTLHDWMPIV